MPCAAASRIANMPSVIAARAARRPILSRSMTSKYSVEV
jgi:hypothetical protein